MGESTWNTLFQEQPQKFGFGWVRKKSENYLIQNKELIFLHSKK